MGNKTHDISGKKLADEIANSVMLASGVTEDGEYTNIVDLNISQIDFQKASKIIKHECVTGDKMNISYTSANEAKK